MIENIRKYVSNISHDPQSNGPRYELVSISATGEHIEAVKNLEEGHVLYHAYESLMTKDGGQTNLLVLRKVEGTEAIIEALTLRVMYLFEVMGEAPEEVLNAILSPYSYTDEVFMDIDIALHLVGLFDWKEEGFDIRSHANASDLYLSAGRREESGDDDFSIDDFLN